MRLLGLTNFYAPLGYGYGAICGDVMGELAARGHHVTVLCADGGAPGPVEVRKGLADVPAAWRRPPAGLRGEAASQRLVRAALAEGVDAALVWHMRGIGKGSLTLLHRAGVPVLYFLGDLWVVYERPGPPGLWKLWQTLDRVRVYSALRQAAGAITGMGRLELRAPPIAEQGIACFVSVSVRDRYARVGFRPRDGHLVPNGVRVEDFANPARGRRGAGEPLRVLFAGRLEHSKGADLAVAAVAELGRAELVIAGAGDETFTGELRRQVLRLGVGDRVRFTGMVTRDRVAGLMGECDVFVMPGRASEDFGLVYIEAMAAGAVVVGTAKGGAGELCRHGENALVVSDRDPGEIAAALRRIRDDPALAERLREGGAQTAARHSLAGMVDRVERLLPNEGR